MNIKTTEFNDLYVLEYNSFKDDRGEFVKTIYKDTFIDNKLEWNFAESFYSVSHQNVFRGMHFQYSPNDHEKLVYVVKGAILDVVLDLRFHSETYGKYLTVELSDKNRKGLYIGKGFAHGFLSLENDTIVEYHTTTVQSKESEGGVKWNSFGFDLFIENPIISERDDSFSPFDKGFKYF
ncbi:dTDP-4-dehydrorhamnose 3,5-epimerase family protein [Flavobacterium praedii]|uniref:dTDP-4-dehydrorhamnose 3,5-epimerase family protein n=1 Tax=Flavobacterium praedii TaxID=3002900 RepID=UPI002481ABB0|nr:dTDP-4-dehydrorhamnose 3,5-epimerase family protein [Flavobacterium praedii]